jgi:hypothetical protein
MRKKFTNRNLAQFECYRGRETAFQALSCQWLTGAVKQFGTLIATLPQVSQIKGFPQIAASPLRESHTNQALLGHRFFPN